MTTTAQMVVLARISAVGADFWHGSNFFWAHYTGTDRSIRKSSFGALRRDGLLTIAPSPCQQTRGTVTVSEAGTQLLAEQPEFLKAEMLRQATIAEHHIRYSRYRRGSGAIRGSRTSYGYEVKCGCDWKIRVNGTQREAEGDYAWHLEKAVTAKLVEAGLDQLTATKGRNR